MLPKIRNSYRLMIGGIVVACGMSKWNNDADVASVYERADKIMYENKAILKNYLTAGT